jgi:hypothetical protein
LTKLLEPATRGVAWLANKLADYDEQLNAGDIVLAGSFTRTTTAVRGDVLHADYRASFTNCTSIQSSAKVLFWAIGDCLGQLVIRGCRDTGARGLLRRLRDAAVRASDPSYIRFGS